MTSPLESSAAESSAAESSAAVDSFSIDLSAFTCPRCNATVGEDFYGPCSSCRDQLRATMRNEASDVQAAAYEPKMNVTPNAVALKE